MAMSEAAKKARRDYANAWREKNKDRISKYHQKWRANNPEKMKEYQDSYWERKAQEY